MGAGNVTIVKIGTTREEKEELLEADGLTESTIKYSLNQDEKGYKEGYQGIMNAPQPGAVVVERPAVTNMANIRTLPKKLMT